MDSFKTQDCAWSNISLTLLGRKLTGLRGFEVEKDVEKEYIYASGSEPVDIQVGNKKYPGSFKLLKFEVDLLNDAALQAGFADITEVPHTLITATIEFKKELIGTIRTISILGIAFTNLKFAMEQNAKMHEVTLTFMAMRLQPLKK
jgi:hypothetical protein